MRKLAPGALGVALLATTVAYSNFGGWAVVKVDKVPDAWVVGKPLTLSWETRQHGVHRLGPDDHLNPTIEARSGSRVVTGTAAAYAEPGWKGFRGTIAFPATGDWQVTINSGFGDARAVLVPWRVVDSARAIRGTVEEHLATLGVPKFSDVERGRRLFAAQGCVSCHVHGDVEITGQMSTIGPELTDRRLPAEYLARFLANPSIRPPTAGRMQMPNLELREKEIQPLVAFLTAGRRAASK